MRPMQCVGGLYLTVADSLGPLLINNNNKNIFQVIPSGRKQKKSLQIFRDVSGVFNGTKNSADLEPRTGQFSRTWGFEAKAKDLEFEAKAKGLKMWPRGRPRSQGRPRGLHLCSLGLGLDLGNWDRRKERAHARSYTSRRASEKKATAHT